MGLTTTATVNLKELFEDWENDILRKNKTAQEVTFADDPIALSWASYRVWTKFPARRWVGLNEVEAFEHDRVIASQTRKYYRDKIMMQTLKGQPLSDYQTLLYGIVSGETPIMSDQVGIIMKLPYFYVEDMTLAEVFGKTAGLESREHVAETRPGTITPVAKILSSRRRAETYQYWFSDSNGISTMWSVLSNNPLRSLVDSLFARGEPLNVQAHWHYKQHFPSDRVHWNLGNVELAS
jgi:hypothetical protein